MDRLLFDTFGKGLHHLGSSVEVSDTSQGADGRAWTAPLDVPPVFSGTQKELAAGVVRMLMEDPVAFHHIG